MSKVAAIILAAGKGSRMKSDRPKQFMELEGKPVLYYSLNVFSSCPQIEKIVLVTGENDIEFCKKDVVEKYNIPKVCDIVAGGEERYWSVLNGLEVVKNYDYVLIHDAARPCVTLDMIEKSIDDVKKVSACTVGVPVKDTIKIVDEDGMGIDTPKRDTLWQIQTPQSFSVKLLMAAYDRMREQKATDITDDTMIVERFAGVKSKVIYGDYCNIKVTTPEDFDVIKFFLKKNKKSC